MTPRLAAENVSKRYEGVKALDGVSVDFLPGEVHAVCGENGAGKSTLMRILCGAVADYEGQLFSRGKPVRFANPREAEADGVAIVYQELNLAGTLSAAANIFLGRELLRWGVWRRDRAMEAEAAKLFERLQASIDPRARVDSLRVGDQQLVEIAKGLSRDADVLILDEPTSALDTGSELNFVEALGRLRRNRTTFVIAHRLSTVRRSDRILVINEGRLVATGTHDELMRTCELYARLAGDFADVKVPRLRALA